MFIWFRSYRIQFTGGEDELHGPPVGDHCHHEEGEGESGCRGFDDPQDDETQQLQDRE